MMDCKDCYHYDVCSKKDEMCKNFKDKSLIIEMLFRVGEEIYVLNRRNIPQRMIFGGLEMSCHCPHEEADSCLDLCDDIPYCICAYRFKNDSSDIGETVFRTKGEAEAKSKDLNSNEN